MKNENDVIELSVDKKNSACRCGCGQYWENCRNGVDGDPLAISFYCHYGYKNFKCGSCNLATRGHDCKNNLIL